MTPKLRCAACATSFPAAEWLVLNPSVHVEWPEGFGSLRHEAAAMVACPHCRAVRLNTRCAVDPGKWRRAGE